MELQWYHGREVTEQERKAITEALGDYAYVLNDEDIQRWIDDSTITLNECRNGRYCVWVVTEAFGRVVYVDNLEGLSDTEVEEQLL